VAFEASNGGEYLLGGGISFHIWGEAEEKAQLFKLRTPGSMMLIIMAGGRPVWLPKVKHALNVWK